MALTFPRPIVHMDLDVGGYSRAAWRIDTSGITSKPYPTPIQMEKLMGQKKEGATIRFPKKIIGVKEVWQQIVIDFVDAVQFKGVSIDLEFNNYFGLPVEVKIDTLLFRNSENGEEVELQRACGAV